MRHTCRSAFLFACVLPVFVFSFCLIFVSVSFQFGCAAARCVLPIWECLGLHRLISHSVWAQWHLKMRVPSELIVALSIRIRFTCGHPESVNRYCLGDSFTWLLALRANVVDGRKLSCCYKNDLLQFQIKFQYVHVDTCHPVASDSNERTTICTRMILLDSVEQHTRTCSAQISPHELPEHKKMQTAINASVWCVMHVYEQRQPFCPLVRHGARSYLCGN